jgi:DNA-binding response OmpR family regulator
MIILIHDLTIDPLAKAVSVHDRPIVLTRKEFDLLYYLASNRNQVVSKSAIADHLSDSSNPHHYNFGFIYSQMKNLKRKLAAAGSKDHIQSVYGMGYKFVE